MNTDTPQSWLEQAAESDPHAAALIFSDGVVSYADLAAQVHARARSLRSVMDEGALVPVVAHLDMASIVEMLAVMKSGGVVVPYDAHLPPGGVRPPGDAAVCLSTSGTGQRPRMVPLSYANIAASVAASRARLGNGPQDRWLATLPLTHVGGLSVLWRSLEAGGAVVVAPFDDSIVDVLEVTRPTFASLVPTMLYRLLEAAPDTLAGIGTVLTGGARIPRSVRDAAADGGVSLVPTYGMTETTSQVATAVLGRPQTSPNVVGPPLEGFEITIDDGDDDTGEPGVIIVEGPAVFGGYLGEPPREGPFRTSDLGYLTPDGDLVVVGRRDDVVVTGGENVDLSVVREVITDLDGVDDTVVVGVSDPEWGTIVCALVEGPDVASRAHVRELVAERLRAPERPKRWRFGQIPLLANGKHDIQAVRRLFTDE